MKKIGCAVAAIICLSGAPAAFAGDEGWYVVGGLGGADSTPLIFDTQNALIAAGQSRFVYNSDNTMGSGRLQAGYQLNKNFALEGGFVHIGTYNYIASGGTLASPYSFSTKLRATYLDAVVILPADEHFSIFAKLGVAHARSTAAPGVTVPFVGVSKTGFTAGLGVKYQFSNGVSIQYESDSYDVGATRIMNVGTLGVGYNF